MLLRNLRLAVRSLARAPGVTFTIVITLALGIGANSAVFSAIDAILLRPLPFPNADRLLQVTQEPGGLVAPIRLEDWNERNSTFEAIAGYSTADLSDTTGELPEKVRRATVSPRFAEVWGVGPALGRSLADSDHRGTPSVVLISDRYWRQRMGAAPDVLGKTIRAGDDALTIVGVMPASFRFPDRDVDLWMPAPLGGTYENWRAAASYTAVGRLLPGATPQQALADLARVQAQLAAEFPDTDRELRALVEPLKAVVVGAAGGSLWLLFGAVTALLLIACTNISALLLSRATRREHEIALRFSLGATRLAVARQLLAETAMLAAIGAAAGVLVAAGASTVFAALAPELPRVDELAPDGRMLAYTLVSTAAVAMLCGVVPAVRGTREIRSVHGLGRGHVAHGQAVHWWFVGVQVALSVALLTGAGLLLRTLDALGRVDTGFDSTGVLTFRMTAEWDETRDWGLIVSRMNRTLDELQALPGIEAAATTHVSPGVPSAWESEFELVGAAAADVPMVAAGHVASPGFFATMQIPLIAGEVCRRPTSDWRPGSPAELMVNRRFAERYLAGRSPLGLQLTGAAWGIFSSGPIVGIVEDARERGINRDPVPTVYICLSAGQPFPIFMARTRGEPLAMVDTIRARLAEIEPGRSMYAVAPLSELIGGAFAENRLRGVLLASFSLTALLLTCLGLYGTLSYIVSLRRREMGLRIALGALSRDIVAQLLRKTLGVVTVAAAAGVALAAAFADTLAGMLYGVSPFDPATLLGVVGIVLLVAIAAALVPSLRAAREDPMNALRDD